MEQIFDFLLQNYGAFGLIIIFVCGLGWLIIKELKKSNESLLTSQKEMATNMSNSISTGMTELTKTLTDDLRKQNQQLIDYLINHDIEKNEAHSRYLIDRKNVTIEINKIIDNLRIEFNASRVCVIEFHNSFFNQTGFPFLKYTVTYEKISKGCTTIQQKYQATQFSSIADVALGVLKSPHHIFELHNRDEIDNIVPIMLCDGRMDVNGAIFKGLFDIENNELIGLIAIEFAKVEDFEPYDSASLISAARTISGFITLAGASKDPNHTSNEK